MITKLQITVKLHYHRKCDFQLSKRKLEYRTLLPLTAPIAIISVPVFFSFRKRTLAVRKMSSSYGYGVKAWCG